MIYWSFVRVILKNAQDTTIKKNVKNDNMLIFCQNNHIFIVTMSLILVSDNKNKLIMTRLKILSLKQ